ncbi:M56 family metallopeptidase [Streptomyces sp. NPDC050619]|uniref:M56 family metallopeptidase n=1 Tax=Streptomyces sp. NPDC050619 TaxID=3157214 RepID=UPI00342D0F19
MIPAVVLAGYAILVGVTAPSLLSRARWPHRAPVLAVFVWHGLMATFVVTTALSVHHVIHAEHHVHHGLVDLLIGCALTGHAPEGGSAPGPVDVLAFVVPALIVLLPFGWSLYCAGRARRARRRHLDVLALVGELVPELGATVVEYAVPAVYCLPGRRRRVVITRGALDVLSEAQLRAVLEHERAHIQGRHHLLHVLVEAFSRAFPGLPLARYAKEQTALLVEMIADDRALRLHPRDVLATAMCEVATASAPQAALGAGGPGALIRLRRVLTPPSRPHRAAWLGGVAATVAGALLPLLMACGL